MTGSGIHYLDAAGPEGVRLYAIGDVHGRIDLLARMHAMIEEDLAAQPALDWRMIHLGDYVDRGPDSKAVMDFLIEALDRDPRIAALAGNHDAGFLEFLEMPSTEGIFANNGGRETGLSYGVDADWRDTESLAENYPAFRAAVPATHLAFLRSLPRFIAFGDFFFCHAGIRPGIALDRQDPEDLIWIRQEFLSSADLHPKVIVHGHTPRNTVEIMPNRVNLDIAAYETGRLAALVIDGRVKRLMEAWV